MKLRHIAIFAALSVMGGLATKAQEFQSEFRAGNVGGQAEFNAGQYRTSSPTEDPNQFKTTYPQSSGTSGSVSSYSQQSSDRSSRTQSHLQRASNLIGREVRNHLNETLGMIQDVVLDFNSGRISYAILSVGNYLGMDQKFIAVPPSAFTLRAGDSSMVLHADRERVARAPGFADIDMPDLENPSWGAQAFWNQNQSSFTQDRARTSWNSHQQRREPDPRAWQSQNQNWRDQRSDLNAPYRSSRDNQWQQRQDTTWRTDVYDRNNRYTPADRTDRHDQYDRGEYRTEFRSDTGTTGYRAEMDHDVMVRKDARLDEPDRYDPNVNVDMDRRRDVEVDVYRTDRRPGRFDGKVVSIDPQTRTIVVESDHETRTFDIVDRPVLQLKENRNPRLVDIKAGYPVRIGYERTSDGRWLAKTIIRTYTPEVK